MGRKASAFVFLQGPVWAKNHTQTWWLNCGDSICELCGITSSSYVDYREQNRYWTFFFIFCQFLSDFGMCPVRRCLPQSFKERRALICFSDPAMDYGGQGWRN